MNIACYLLKTDGTFKQTLLPEELIVGLAKSLREKGVETVRFVNEQILYEGIFVPAKDSKHSIVAIPNIEE